MDQVEDRICDLDARGSEEADNLANDRDLDRFILTGNFFSNYDDFRKVLSVEFHMREGSYLLMVFVIVFHKTIEHHRCVQVLSLMTYCNLMVSLE